MRKSEELIKKETRDEVLELFKTSFELIGVVTLTSLIEAYNSEIVDWDELVERVEEFNNQFDLSDFLKTKNQRVRNEAIKLGESYYSLTGIVSLGVNKVYNTEECKLKYQIILNPTTSEIIKLLYANICIMEFDEESERDEELNYLVDKLNLLGIRHITIR